MSRSAITCLARFGTHTQHGIRTDELATHHARRTGQHHRMCTLVLDLIIDECDGILFQTEVRRKLGHGSTCVRARVKFSYDSNGIVTSEGYNNRVTRVRVIGCVLVVL